MNTTLADGPNIQTALDVPPGRATALRDAIVDHLTGVFADYSVEPFWIPDFEREELGAGPIIGVRVGGREANILMGVDRRLVTIEVGVFGLSYLNDTLELGPKEIRRRTVALNDSYDALLEQVMKQWTPQPAPLSSSNLLAEHSFEQFGQPQPVDPDALHERGIWLGTFFVQYHDKLDEGNPDD